MNAAISMYLVPPCTTMPKIGKAETFTISSMVTHTSIKLTVRAMVVAQKLPK